MKHFPKYDDLDLAADAIVRLQELYGDVADFTLPRENNSKDVLTGKICSMKSVCACAHVRALCVCACVCVSQHKLSVFHETCS